MRVKQISCPECGATLKSQAGIAVGQSVACPKCKHKFKVQAPDEPDVIDDADLVDDEPPPRSRTRSDRDDDERPARAKKSGKGTKTRSRDDDDDDPPRKRKKKSNRRGGDEEPDNLYWRLRKNVLVRVLTLVVLLGVLAVLAYLLYEKKKAEKELEKASHDPVSNLVARGDIGPASTAIAV